MNNLEFIKNNKQKKIEQMKKLYIYKLQKILNNK